MRGFVPRLAASLPGTAPTSHNRGRGASGMSVYPQHIGNLRASAFDAHISAARLDRTAKALEQGAPQRSEEVARLASEARELAGKIAALLSPEMQADLKRAFR